MSADTLEELAAAWHPAPTRASGVLCAGPVARLAALLGTAAPREGDELPPLWHEVLLRDAVGLGELAADGHPAGGPLLPPLADRRRMFGGSTVQTQAPLRLGEHATRDSRVADVRVRQGRSGPLLLVTEEHAWSVAGSTRLLERRDLVYRRPAGPVAGGGVGRDPKGSRVPVPVPVPVPAQVSDPDRADEPPVLDRPWTVVPDERYLFAYSALTYNLHRIHYDLGYARDVEQHPGLVVHGPLLALWCAEHARRLIRSAGAPPDNRWDYRLVATAYAGDPVVIGGVRDPDGLRVEAWSGGRRCAWLRAPG